jgi:hypothetical protein
VVYLQDSFGDGLFEGAKSVNCYADAAWHCSLAKHVPGGEPWGFHSPSTRVRPIIVDLLETTIEEAMLLIYYLRSRNFGILNTCSEYSCAGSSRLLLSLHRDQAFVDILSSAFEQLSKSVSQPVSVFWPVILRAISRQTPTSNIDL